MGTHVADGQRHIRSDLALDGEAPLIYVGSMRRTLDC